MDDLELRRWKPEEPARISFVDKYRLPLIAGGVVAVLLIIAAMVTLSGGPAHKDQAATATPADAAAVPAADEAPLKPAVSTASSAAPAIHAPAPVKPKAPVHVAKKAVVKPKPAKAKPAAKANPPAKKPVKAKPKAPPKKKEATLDLDALSKFPSKSSKSH